MTSVNEADVDDAFLSSLRAAFPNVLIGDAEKPDGATEQTGYAIVFPIPSGNRTQGPVYARGGDSIRWVRYQLLAEGVQRNQVRRLANDLAAAVVAVDAQRAYTLAIAPTGHAVIDRRRVGSIPLDTLGTWQAGELVDLLVTIT